ncbi:MAG: ImmA/IrrE family metallo-endopeptidase [Desulfovibrionaceae bacterium]|nr:ImmA/IrrE family metallo-endopeptidase [Desulfovibrionaceae bacterium]
MLRVPVHPTLLRWARQRAGLEVADLLTRFPKLDHWEQGEELPTLRQLEHFAQAVHVPVGYLFLPTPPEEHLPIPDFRTIAGQEIHRPSPNLLDAIHACQEKQAWYREFAQFTKQAHVEFIGSATADMPPETVALQMLDTFQFGLEDRRRCRNWEECLRYFCLSAEKAGVLVMVSGVVGSNNNRKLDPEEFRGFSLSDRLAPLVFVNGNDTKAARMFTLAHELAHLWLGTTALSDMGAAPRQGRRREEVWCNKVAAEYLVPTAVLNGEFDANEPLDQALKRIGGIFKVSSLVVLRRLLDIGRIDRGEFDAAWGAEVLRFRRVSSGGGDFYKTTMTRASRRFTRALAESTLEGQTLYRDAFRMLGISKTETFMNLAREAGLQ